MGTHVKNAGPQIGDSTGDFEDQAWTLVEENVAFNWSIRGYLIFSRQGDSICLRNCFAILTCLIALDDQLIAYSLQHDSLSHMLDRTLIVWYLSAWYDFLLHDNPFSCMIVWLLCLCSLSHFRSSLSVEIWEPSPLGNPLGKRGSACVEVMTTLHGSTPYPWRRVEGCVSPEGTIASTRDPLTHPFYPIEPLQPCRLA